MCGCWLHLDCFGNDAAVPIRSQVGRRQIPRSSTWSEPFPPKLSGEAITQHRRQFESSYPGEVLDNESMPGHRMMALSTKLGQAGEMRWIAWKHRLSKTQEEAQTLRRPAKVPVLGRNPNSCASRHGGHGLCSEHSGVSQYIVRLLEKAYLHNLSLYERKFVKPSNGARQAGVFVS